MKDNQVFFDSDEIKRLNTQKRLFSEYERALYEKVLSGDRLSVLDVGCNNGDKTKEKFDVPNVKHVIGIEYHQNLTDHAQKTYGSDKLAFYQCDVEKECFTERLRSVMAMHDIDGFDIIHLSLVLSHLTDPEKLLCDLRRFLSPNGRLVILESDDSAVELVPDVHRIMPEVMNCVASDAFAGDRTLTSRLPDILRSTGYRDVEITEVSIAAEGDDEAKKKDIYDVFFSYLLSDFEILLKEDPQNETYAKCRDWLTSNKARIRDSICRLCDRVSIGIKLFAAYGGICLPELGECTIERLTADSIPTALKLCDENVGKNLYSADELSKSIDSDKCYFHLLYDSDRTPIGYSYFLLLSKAEFVEFSKVDESQFESLGYSDDVVIGNLQSLSIDKKYRGKHYATLLFDFMVQYLENHTNADVATGVLWKMGDDIPMKKVFEQFAFSHLVDTELVWHDREDLICPYCNGRCVCGASVYYKKLGVK